MTDPRIGQESQISDAELATVPLTPQEWHGDWNYTITAHSDVA